MKPQNHYLTGSEGGKIILERSLVKMYLCIDFVVSLEIQDGHTFIL